MSSRAPATPRQLPPDVVVWHDLECGAYRADLALWLRLAAEAGTPGQPARVLDIGAGTGRVALALARAGHPVTALDLDPVVLEALRGRASGLPVRTVTADARSFALQPPEHDLGLVPMQTLQLLRGAEERLGLLERAHAHLRPGALLALAIVTEVEEFDSRNGGIGPTPEHAGVGGALYVSRAVRVDVGDRFIRIERERFVESRDGDPVYRPELDVIELERITPGQLAEEALAAGWTVEPHVTIPDTEDHSGSEVVILRA